MENIGVPETVRLSGNPVLTATETAALVAIKNEMLSTSSCIFWRQTVHPNGITTAQDFTSLFPLP